MVISRKVLEQAQKVARTGHFILDIQTNTIVSSPSFDDIPGLDVNLPKSMEHCLGHILPEFQPKIWNRLQEIMQNGGRFAEDFIIVRPVDGEQRWISAFGELSRNTEHQTVTRNGVIQDISEGKQAEAAAEFAQRDLQSIISTLPDIVLRFNAAYEFTYCHTNNPEDLLVPAEQLIGIPVDAVIPPEITQIFHEKAEKNRISGKVESFEYFLPISSSEKEWFEARMISNTQDEIVCVIRDITEQKHAANALKESHPSRQSEIYIRYKVDNHRTILEISDNGLGIDLEKNRDKIFGMYKTFHGNIVTAK
jgi:PAS domain-containing protein